MRPSYARHDFDDAGWRELDLPHDWGIEGPFEQHRPGSTGKLPWDGVGWYRKRFRLDPAEVGERRVELEVDGAMSHTTVWFNGRCVGAWVYGYSSWHVDLTGHLADDGDNVLALRLDNPPNSSRWYPGAGLYRHVWLSLTPAVRFAPWGVHVTTPKVTPEQAWVDVNVVVENKAANATEVSLETFLYALRGEDRVDEPVASATTTEVSLDPVQGHQAHRRHSLTVASPQLWDVDAPHRYVAISRLSVDGRVIDEIETRCGIRSIAFDADHGFLLNGRRVPINGVCQHHDLGALGAAVNTRALERQLELLREMGCNAIRTAHNPPTPELLDLCVRTAREAGRIRLLVTSPDLAAAAISLQSTDASA
jgi:beta-galactosidase